MQPLSPFAPGLRRA